MPHLDPEILALLALGEPSDQVATAAQRDHLATCADCRAEVADLGRTVHLARGIEAEDRPMPPDPAVWSRIRAELDLPVAGEVDPVDAGVPSAPSRRHGSRKARGHRLRVLAGATAVVTVVAGVWWLRSSDGTTTIATASLEAMPGWPRAHGSATVDEDADGVRRVVVTLEGQLPTEGLREVWLIAADQSGLISIGLLDGTTGSFDVPDGIDLARYDLVDVSKEPVDGDPAHSGDSVVRGQLISS